MNFKEIEELLRKYYDGATSLEEENLLRDFFRSEEVPPHLSVEAELFRAMDGNRRDEITDPDFEKNLLAALEGPKVIPVTAGRTRLYRILAVAAGLLLLGGIFFTFRHDILRQPVKDTYTDPAKAYAETEKVLTLISSNLNRGLDKVAYLSKFSDGITDMQKISAFYKYQSIIINPDEFNRSTKH
ncbi:MAG TPA: hypothetical protein VMC08_06065 [Bacteroidales bacterium]|nr:hypothetical protein [Bacteroidales bacterium]